VAALRLACWPAGIALGVVAEATARPELVALDSLAGFALLGAGLVSWSYRPRSWTGPLLTVAAFAWFAGTFGGWPLYLHRGVLANVLLVYPAVRLLPVGWLEGAAIVAGYGYAATTAVNGDDRAMLVFAGVLVGFAAWRPLAIRGPERRARVTGLAAAVVFGGATAFAALARLFELGVSGRTTLALYDAAVCLVAFLLAGDLLFGGWARATVTGLVVDVGAGGPRTLAERLSRTLGDPSLVLGYWVEERREYVDDLGRTLEVSRNDGRVVTTVDDGDTPLAAVVHDPALEDPALIAGVSAAVRLAVSNLRLRADVRARVAEVEASRRRIVEAADEQRRRLEQDLRDGAERRLAHVATLVAGDPELRVQLAGAQAELRELARGIHPAALTEHGLGDALRELATRSPVPVDVAVRPERFPPAIEAAAYFVCSESLANAAKHASATRVRIAVAQRDGRLRVEVDDNGVGGADPAAGSGLRGLADRLEALGGRLQVVSDAGAGTRVVGEFPLQVPG
jgi:signal transduction histidine kinase